MLKRWYDGQIERAAYLRIEREFGTRWLTVRDSEGDGTLLDRLFKCTCAARKAGRDESIRPHKIPPILTHLMIM